MKPVKKWHKKKQHWVPTGYLKVWCDPHVLPGHEPYVWQFDKDGSSARRKAPRKLFFETDTYTIRLPNGTRDLRVEDGLGGLESRFVSLRRTKLEKRLPLGEEDRSLLRLFVAAMQIRVPAQLDKIGTLFRSMADSGKAIERAVRAGRAATVSGPPGRSSMSQVQVEAASTAARGSWLGPMLRPQAAILCGMHLTVLETGDELGFITSDSPCVWCDPQEVESAGLASPTIEITLPCSPSQMLILTWRPAPLYATASASLLNELNRRTRLHARQHFVVRSNRTRPEWFR